MSASDRRINLSPFAIDAIAGAMGEIVQICVLYPLDTIKVSPLFGSV